MDHLQSEVTQNFTLDVTKQVQKNSFISDVLLDQV